MNIENSALVSIQPIETTHKDLSCFYAVEIIMFFGYIKLKKAFKW